MLRKALAFLKKDLLIECSYNMVFFLNSVGLFSGILCYFFIDKLFGSRIVGHLEEFGVNYFSYVLLSMALFSYIGVGIGSFSERIRAEQVQGTLEAVMATPTNITTILFSLNLWGMVTATVNVVIYAIFAVFIFRIDFSSINILSTVIVFLLTVVSFSSLGIISACFIMALKRGNPFSWILASVEGLIGGVYFPVKVMPAWLQKISALFPITYSIRAIELAVYKGYGVNQLHNEILFLILFSVILLPVSLFAFKISIMKARRDGTLAQY